MTRAQALRFVGRLVLIDERHAPADWAGEPAVVLGRNRPSGSLIVGWADAEVGWELLPTDSFRGGYRGCVSGWYVEPEWLELLPPGAAVKS